MLLIFAFRPTSRITLYFVGWIAAHLRSRPLQCPYLLPPKIFPVLPPPFRPRPAVPLSETAPLEGGRWLLMGIRKSGPPKAAGAAWPADSEGTATPTTESEEARSSSPPGST